MMIKSIIFYISIISFILLSILVFEMLPFIYEMGFFGLLFLGIIISMFISELYMLINKKDIIKNMSLNNSLIIIGTMYISFLSYIIYSSIDLLSFKSNYFKINYLILSLLFVFIIINMIEDSYKINEK